MDYRRLIRRIPGYPKPGIIFEDITTLWKDAAGFSETLKSLAAPFKDKKITKVIGLEARGFIIAAPIAVELKAGFVPIRKPGKLPAEVITATYELEYGLGEFCIHKDALSKEDRILICDDVLATGGSVEAAIKLVKLLGAEIVGVALLQELTYLKGREKFPKVEVFSLYQVDQ